MRRWTSVYRLAWTPIITFTARRLQLLQWVEDNLEPVAFSEGPDHVGVALVNRGLRILVHRDGAHLEDSVAHAEGVSPLAPMLTGLFSVLEPKQVKLRSASVAWSAELEGRDYNEARAHFASSLVGFQELPSGLRSADASGLMDLESSTHHAQVEWGIVSNDELLLRVEQPSIGRLAENRPSLDAFGIEASDLPAASLFVDETVALLNPSEIASSEEVLVQVAEVDRISAEVAASIYAGLGMENTK